MPKILVLSRPLAAFLAAEIANEAEGGDSPTTFGSARDSLQQMPDGVLAGLNPELEALAEDSLPTALAAEIMRDLDRAIRVHGRRRAVRWEDLPAEWLTGRPKTAQKRGRAASTTAAATARPLLGFQLADKAGTNIQGDPEDPTGYASFEIMTPATAIEMIRRHPEFLLMPIFEGDIEEPTLV